MADTAKTTAAAKDLNNQAADTAKLAADKGNQATQEVTNQAAAATKENADRFADTAQDAANTAQQVTEEALGNLEESVDRIREFNERLIESSKASGNVALDTYEKALKSMLDFQRSMANASQIEWVNTVANTQVQFVQDISDAYTKAARELLK